MTVSKAQQNAVNKYNAANYDRLYIRVRKGGKEKINDHIINTGETLNEFINRAINETIDRDMRK